MSDALSRLGQTLSRVTTMLLKKASQTNHNRLVAFGGLVLVAFLPTWVAIAWQSMLKGSSSFLLSAGFLYLGLDRLWRQRQTLAAEPPVDEERVLGYLLILVGAVSFPLLHTSASLLALVCMTIVLGIVICNFGLAGVHRYPLAIGLILISLYPDLGFLANTLRKVLTGNQLEVLMASLGGWALRGMGETVTVQGDLISLAATLDPDRSVLVGSGCSGFDMAFPIAGVAFILGLYLKQSWQKIGWLVAIGVVLSLLFNVPRIMLLAIAVVYWGKESFEFWHGPIGGQIFSSVLLTGYYYLAMAIIDQPTQPKSQ
jgi:exosortase/archaeosortase family protein